MKEFLSSNYRFYINISLYREEGEKKCDDVKKGTQEKSLPAFSVREKKFRHHFVIKTFAIFHPTTIFLCDLTRGGLGSVEDYLSRLWLCIQHDQKSEKKISNFSCIDFHEQNIECPFLLQNNSSSSRNKMPTSGRKIFEKRKCLYVFVEGGVWGRREKNPNIVSSLRGEKSLTKKNKKKCLTPIQSNTNGSREKKRERKKKIARKKLHNFFSLLSAYVVECLSVICCCNCCCRKKIYYATQYLPFIPLPIHLYGTFFSLYYT